MLRSAHSALHGSLAVLAVAGLGVVIAFTTCLMPKLQGLIETTRGKVPPLATAMASVSFFEHSGSIERRQSQRDESK